MSLKSTGHGIGMCIHIYVCVCVYIISLIYSKKLDKVNSCKV